MLPRTGSESLEKLFILFTDFFYTKLAPTINIQNMSCSCLNHMLLLSDAQLKKEIKELRAINAEQFASIAEQREFIAEQRAINDQQTEEIN